MKRFLAILALILIFLSPTISRANPSPNLVRGAKVRTSSTLQPYVADKAVDGIVANDSRWLSNDSMGPHVLEIDFGRKVNIGCVQVLMGWKNHGLWISAVQNFKIQFHKEDQWKDDEKLQISNNQKTGVEIYLIEPIQSDKIRFVSSDPGPIRIAEIRVFEWGGEYPSLFDEEEIVFTKHPVFVNQSGYDLGWPKRFTAPLVKETAQFTITEVGSIDILYQGTVNKGVGDFSDFAPTGHGIEYMITVTGGQLQPGQSDPFRIESEWIRRICADRTERYRKAPSA